MIRQRAKFSFSEYFYAIDVSSLRIDKTDAKGSVSATVEAIWFKRKDGIEAICSGTLWAFTAPQNGNPDINDFSDFMKVHDGRYGGNTQYKWDGYEMWGYKNDWDELVKAHDRLDPLLDQFPNIPAGFDGWFSIK